MERQDTVPGPHGRFPAGHRMSVRIVAGDLGGRRIRVPPGRRVRPTGERVREAWFSALGPRIEGAAVIDLFAGSGALGIEALSRGASTVQFVEEDRRCVETLNRNVASLGIATRVRVHRGDVFDVLARLHGEAPFDVALADPPYGQGLAARLVAEFVRRPFAGLLCVERSVDDATGSDAIWERRYGDTVVSFFSDPKGGDSGDS